MMPCFTKQLTGLECPACGAQRAFVALINGNFITSLLYFPALIPSIVTIFFVKRPKIFLALLVIDLVLVVLGYFTRHLIL